MNDLQLSDTSAVVGKTRTLPHDWRWVRLGEVCKINPHRPANLQRPADAPTTFIPMSAVDERLGMVVRPEAKPFASVKKGYTYFREGDVLFAKITPCMQNGKHAIARDLTDGLGFGTTEFHVLRPSPDILSDWIHKFLRQPRVLQAATAHFTGTVGQQRVPEEFLATLEIPIPPLAEQKRIAAILNEQMAALERARAAAEARLDAAKALPAAYLRVVFTSPEARQWPRKRLEELCELKHGGTPTKANTSFWQGGIPWVSPKDMRSAVISGTQDHISEDAVSNSSTCVVPDGTILAVVRSGILARTFPIAITGTKVSFNQDIKAVLPDRQRIDLWFLYWTLIHKKPHILANGIKKGATVHSVRSGFIESLEIPVPPLAEQQRIAGCLSEQMAAVEQTQKALDAQLATINALPGALLLHAFSGAF